MPKNNQIGSTSPAADTCRTSSAERPDVLPLPAVPGRQLEKLSIVIPARDEAGCIASTVEHLHLELTLQGIRHEIVVVDDGSRDETYGILEATTARIPNLVPVRSPGPHGFGRAIQRGLDAFSGDAVVIMMADESDDCRDVVRYWRILQEGHDCVFGSRFTKGGGVIDYPRIKYAVNRLANWFVRTLFGIRLNDTTNAFKAYRREVIDGCRLLLHRRVRLAGKVFQPRGLPQAGGHRTGGPARDNRCRVTKTPPTGGTDQGLRATTRNCLPNQRQAAGHRR